MKVSPIPAVTLALALACSPIPAVAGGLPLALPRRLSAVPEDWIMPSNSFQLLEPTAYSGFESRPRVTPGVLCAKFRLAKQPLKEWI